MKSIPIYDETVPISCTLDRSEVTARIDLIERLRGDLIGLERTEHGMLLHFPLRADVADDLRRFTVDEKQCCAFWGFDVTEDDRQIALRWDAPPAAADLVIQLVAYFEGDLPISEVSGLL